MAHYSVGARSRVITLKRANPDASNLEIADKVGVSKVRVWQILVEAGIITPGEHVPREPRAGEHIRLVEPPKPRPAIVANAMPWATKALLMGGRAPRAKLQPA
jgi:hypothetical protein